MNKLDGGDILKGNATLTLFTIEEIVCIKMVIEKTDELKVELRNHVRSDVGPIASPEKIQWADALPKTRSGKIMRRILKRIPNCR